ncbi:MAG: hypothetical protein JOZ42_02365 [Acetobacteraceae bacterium]|nr:hypothetical protein [Acetobacteraceae bacterium]
MPYTALINPQIRLAYAECAAAMVIPLFFAAIDAALGDVRRTIVFVGPATALLAIVHLPSTVLAGGLGAIYAGLGYRRLVLALRGSALAASGVAFGLGMAAYFVVPAVTLLNDISPAALTDMVRSPETNFLLIANEFRTGHGALHGLLLDLSLVIPLAACLATAPAALRANPRSRAIVGTCLIAAVLTLPVSGFVWRYLPPLRMVQFPWRALLVVSLLASTCVAVALPVLKTVIRRVILCSAAILAVGNFAIALRLSDGFTSAASRTQQVLQEGGGDAPEYLPADAARQGWFDVAHPGPGNVTRAAAFVSPCLRKGGETASAEELTFDVHDCSGRLVLPQFYFPGWVAVTGTAALPVAPDPHSGLASAILGEGSRTLLLRRKMLGAEKLGAAISIVCIVLWAALAFQIVGQRQRQHPG